MSQIESTEKKIYELCANIECELLISVNYCDKNKFAHTYKCNDFLLFSIMFHCFSMPFFSNEVCVVKVAVLISSMTFFPHHFILFLHRSVSFKDLYITNPPPY